MTIPSRVSIFLLALAGVAGCTVESTNDAASHPAASTDGDTDDSSDHEVTELPADLRGTWLDSWSTSMQYKLAKDAYDFDTGVWFGGLPDLWDMAPNRGFGIELAANGSFVWVRGSDGGVGGCQSYAVEVIKGTAAAQGDTLRLRVTAHRQRYESTCDPSLNYDRSVADEVIEVTYERGATVDTGLPTLRLTDHSKTTFDYFKN